MVFHSLNTGKARLTARLHPCLDNERPSLAIYIGIRHIGCRIFTLSNAYIRFHQLDRSLMISWRKNWEKIMKPWKGVPCFHFRVCLSVCLSVCTRATEDTFWLRNLFSPMFAFLYPLCTLLSSVWDLFRLTCALSFVAPPSLDLLTPLIKKTQTLLNPYSERQGCQNSTWYWPLW